MNRKKGNTFYEGTRKSFVVWFNHPQKGNDYMTPYSKCFSRGVLKCCRKNVTFFLFRGKKKWEGILSPKDIYGGTAYAESVGSDRSLRKRQN